MTPLGLMCSPPPVVKALQRRSALSVLALLALVAFPAARGAERSNGIIQVGLQAPGGTPAAPAVDLRLDVAAPANGRPTASVMLAASSAGKRIVVAGERGTVVLSDDCAARWTQARVPVGVTLTALGFADDQHGWAVGHGGVVLASRDSGATWTKQLDGRAIAQLALASARKAAAAGQIDAERLKLAVADAERMVADGPDKPLFAGHFWTPQRGIVVGAFGLALATEDGGANWQWIADRMPNPKGLHLYGVWARDDQVYVVGEQGLVLRSSDRARSFQPVSTPYVGSYFGVSGATTGAASEVMIYGLRGHAYRLSAASQAFEPLKTASQATVLGVLPRADGSSLLFDGDGLIFEVGGAAPDARLLATSPVGPVLSATPACGQSVVLAGMRGIAVVDPVAMALASAKGVTK